MSNLTLPTTPIGGVSTIDYCQGCTGTCRKESNKYTIPVTRYLYGVPYDCVALCEFGEERLQHANFAKAQIPRKYIGRTFNDYTITPENERAVGLAKGIVARKLDKGLYLYGGVGTGKTYLASLIAQAFMHEGNTLIFGDVPTLLDEIKRAFDTGKSAAVIDSYCGCDLLILDDIGAGQITEWNVGVLYRIINARYNAQKPVVATSNYDLRGLDDTLSRKDSSAGKRIVSRLAEMTYQAFLGLNDRRR